MKLVARAVGTVGAAAGLWSLSSAAQRRAVSSLPQGRSPITCHEFIEQQQSFGIPAQEIVSDMLIDMRGLAKVPLGVQGPSSFGSSPISTMADVALKLGHNTQPQLTETGALTDAFGSEHLVRGENPTDALNIFFGRASTYLEQLRPKLFAGSRYVSFNAGSLNSYDATKGSTNTVRGVVDALSGYEMGHTVKAETGIADYRKSWWAARINAGRRGYDKSLAAGLYMNLLIKMQNPEVITTNVSHSWGCPSTIQNYAFAMATFEANAGQEGIPRSLPLPVDHLICVDPRCITGPTQAKALASQINYLRSRGVKVDIIKDTAKTTGFGLVDTFSSLNYVVEGTTGVQDGVFVDGLISTNLGHSLTNHTEGIKALLLNPL